MSDSTRKTLVVGARLAAQLTAPLLARLGQKVTHLSPAAEPTTDWNSCPPLLHRLLDSLNARACLRPARPLQIITAHNRVELHGGVPLQDELRREFPTGHPQLTELLDGLQRLASRLEDYLWESEGFPAGLTGHLTAPWLRLRFALIGAGLTRPLHELLNNFGALEQEWLKTLFAGYACTPWEELSRAEAALIWAEVNSSQELSRTALREQLKNRLAEFSGEWQTADPQSLHLQTGQRPLLTAGNNSYNAETLLSETDLATEVPPTDENPARTALEVRFHSGRPAGHVADRLLLCGAGQPPLRLALKQQNGFISGMLESAPGLFGTRDSLCSLFETVFPFSTLEFRLPDQLQVVPGRHKFLGLRGKLRRAARSWNLSADQLLPTLGNTGDCILAMSLVSRQAG